MVKVPFGVAIFLVSSALPAQSSSANARKLPTMLAVTSPPVVVQSMYVNPDHLMTGAGHADASGAVAENATGPTVIERQRWGADLVEAALVMHTSPNLGMAVIDFGYKVQQPDGSFGKDNGFQGTSFFMEATARTLILLKQTGDPVYAEWIAATTPKLLKAAQYFVSSGEMKEQEAKGLIFTHRYWLMASALGEAGAITRDGDLMKLGATYAKMGLAHQLPDGTNPEKDGFDVNYGAASGLFAIRYYAICTDPELRKGIEQMLSKAMSREAKSILPDGTVSMEDSTRTGKDAEHNNTGKKKGIDHKGIIPFFAAGAVITGEAQYGELARRIAVKKGWM